MSGMTCQVQQRDTTLAFWAWYDHYQSLESVSVSVITGLMQMMSQAQLIDF